jgi:hypothetical protein
MGVHPSDKPGFGIFKKVVCCGTHNVVAVSSIIVKKVFRLHTYIHCSKYTITT